MNFKVGDEVVVEFSNGFQLEKQITKICSITPARGLIKVVGFNDSFDPDSGVATGSGFRRNTIIPVTDELRDEIKKANMVRRLKNFKWEKLSLSEIREVFAILIKNEKLAAAK